MGYLTDNTTVSRYGTIGDCPDLYPYALVVQWVVNDPYFYPDSIHQLLFAIQEVLPDVEDWQLSVYVKRENRAKLRFKDEATRTTARTKLAAVVSGPTRVFNLVNLNPPDRAQAGVA